MFAEGLACQGTGQNRVHAVLGMNIKLPAILCPSSLAAVVVLSFLAVP
jgi:hypothetical protein